jgi:uncharacterized protein (DUF983 family)
MRNPQWDEEEDELDDETWDEDDDGLVPCPYCGEDMLEVSPRCPECGRYISDEDRPAEKKPPWIVVGIVVCLVIALAWAAGM